ncbi:energy transducer TonB [Aquincola sp. S2]|uniref:Energy transducer TonB n=1 Tax=Pseudaquabacterium terrae TaxID=2732868 RepID=A0ABX2EUG8_9BURK|nr:energy transducer TonB [Aquabacterium terrae]NRF72115.1 energy transducer TonB [Aquabacterium terrae]
MQHFVAQYSIAIQTLGSALLALGPSRAAKKAAPLPQTPTVKKTMRLALQFALLPFLIAASGCTTPPEQYIIVNTGSPALRTQGEAEAEFLINGLFGNRWSQYDTRPKILYAELPKYPIAARRAGAEGPVECIVTIAPSGKVSEVKVVRSPHPFLTEEVQRAARTWEFEPILKNAIPVEVKVPFRYIYRLQ